MTTRFLQVKIDVYKRQDVKKVMASPEVRETFGLDVVGGVHA